MLFHASDPVARGFQVYHAERCCVLPNVVWVDTDRLVYACFVQPVTVDPATRTIATQLYQAKRIEVDFTRRFITINPIEDAAPEALTSTEAYGPKKNTTAASSDNRRQTDKH